MLEEDMSAYLGARTSLKSGKCRCDICKGDAQIRGILRRGDRKEMRKCIRLLDEILCNMGEELDMANAYISDIKNEAK